MAGVERGYASLMGSRLTLHYNLAFVALAGGGRKVHRCKNGSESTLAVCVDLKQKLPGQDEVSCL